MAFSQLVEAHHKLAYSNNVILVNQQKGSKLRGTVTEVPCTGEAHDAAELVGEVDYYEGDGSRPRTNIETVPQSERRWLIRPPEIKSGQYIDKEDVFDSINYPTAKIVQAHTMAVNRGIDDKILGVRKLPDGTFGIRDGGVLGGVIEGKRPGNARIALPSEYVTPHGSARLTLDKLLMGREKLGVDENDMTAMLNMAITPYQHTDLLRIVTIARAALSMFQEPVMQSGRVTQFLGYNFWETMRLPKTGNIRLNPIWTKANIALGIWQDVQGTMWNDSHADNRPYSKVEAYMDCVRVQDKGVHVIEADESAAPET